jgi:hypothetical protein
MNGTQVNERPLRGGPLDVTGLTNHDKPQHGTGPDFVA